MLLIFKHVYEYLNTKIRFKDCLEGFETFGGIPLQQYGNQHSCHVLNVISTPCILRFFFSHGNHNQAEITLLYINWKTKLGLDKV